MQDCLYPNRHSQEVCARILHSYYGCRWSVVANTCCTHWSQADSWISRPHKFSWLIWETGITVQDKRFLPFPGPSPSNWQLRSGDVGIESPGIPCYCSPCCTSEMCPSFHLVRGKCLQITLYLCQSYKELVLRNLLPRSHICNLSSTNET